MQAPEHFPPSQEAYRPLTPSLRLYLANNNLTAIPSEIYRLHNLTELSLRQNQLITISPSISILASLDELNVSGNNLHYLPYEIIDLVSRPNFRDIRCHPNPFFIPVFPSLGHSQDCDNLRRNDEYLVAVTPTAYLDINGNPYRGSIPAPSSTDTYILTKSPRFRPPQSELTTTPSLLESALRSISTVPNLNQFISYASKYGPASLSQVLQRAWTTRQTGGVRCTVCRKEYIVPRTEWIEWWKNVFPRSGHPVPLLRRGCSWACTSNPDQDGDVEAYRRICGWKIGDEAD